MQGKKWMERICRQYSDILGEQLTGVYLHGSAAFGCASGASDRILSWSCQVRLHSSKRGR